MTPELQKTFVSLINRPDPTILDIGCNDGSETITFLSIFPEARLYCFEPEPRAQQHFLRAVRSTRATLVRSVVGSVDGTVTFHQSSGLPNEESARSRPEGWDYSGSIRKPKLHLKHHPWCLFQSSIEVPSTRLDTWARGVPLIDLIWADVQGAEVDLVKGGLETLCRTRFFYTEIDELEMYEGQINLHGLLAMLPAFEVVERFPYDVLLRNRFL